MELDEDLTLFKSEKEILCRHSIVYTLTALTGFQKDIDEALTTTNNNVVLSFDTEWPVYIEGCIYNKKTNGNINIVTLGSNIVSYIIILELYNFSNNNNLLRQIDQTLTAFFPHGCHSYLHMSS